MNKGKLGKKINVVDLRFDDFYLYYLTLAQNLSKVVRSYGIYYNLSGYAFKISWRTESSEALATAPVSASSSERTNDMATPLVSYLPARPT